MINTIAYTYWNKNKDCTCNNFNSLDNLKTQWKRSYDSIKEFCNGFEIIVVCDEIGKDIAKECCPDATIIVKDFSEYCFDERFWNIPKIITFDLMAKMNKPFLHIDMDVEITKELTPEQLTSDILTEKTRENNLGSSFIRQLGYSFSKSSYIVCCGLIGGNRLDIFERQLEMALAGDTSNITKISVFNLYTVEELTLTDICIKENVKITELHGYYIHHQGKLKNIRTIY